METSSQRLGSAGEELAALRLADAGYKVLLRNYACALGEIDIIAKHRGELVFIEVKTRSSCDMGRPEEAVTFDKRRQITRAALYYMKRYGILDVACRFDVVSVLVGPAADAAVEIIENAFSEAR